MRPAMVINHGRDLGQIKVLPADRVTHPDVRLFTQWNTHQPARANAFCAPWVHQTQQQSAWSQLGSLNGARYRQAASG